MGQVKNRLVLSDIFELESVIYNFSLKKYQTFVTFLIYVGSNLRRVGRLASARYPLKRN